MIYTDNTRKAMILAYYAHQNQFDKSGVPYIYHPIHLAEQMDSEEECIVALLHDIVEDTDVSFEDLEHDFSKEFVDAIRLLTHNPEINYWDYVRTIKNNPLAKKVKIADLRHNSDLTRLLNPPEKILNKIQNVYRQSIDILTD